MREETPLPLPLPELVALVASLMALNALSIDIMLPALPDIGRDFALGAANDRQLIIVVYVFMFGISQLIYGPLSDAFGRRAVLLWATAFYIVGALLCTIAPSFELMLAARALQGVAAGATRVIATALVRDLTSGPRMAQIMSMAMTVFMIVPILAPGLGQLILFVAPWRWIFGALLVYAVIVLIWAYLRLPETLRPENTTPFHLRAIARAARAVLSDRQAFGYMIASTFIVGCMFGYVTSSEQLFVDVYDLGDRFALAFAAVAVAMSAGAFLNSRLVVRFGMRRISQSGLLVFSWLQRHSNGAGDARLRAILVVFQPSLAGAGRVRADRWKFQRAGDGECRPHGGIGRIALWRGDWRGGRDCRRLDRTPV
ncbi:MAG: multidrug effflux MFS transporter [Terricaulis sp.]|nr:multidrug effflux MFS transporter [Terricaulis sp.]